MAICLVGKGKGLQHSGGVVRARKFKAHSG